MTDLRRAYDAHVARGLSRDPSQVEVVDRLERLRAELDAASGLLDRWLGRRTPPRGVYIWGDVGRGKSMLVDLLMECCYPSRSTRIHFQAFMRDLHRALHHARQEGAEAPVEAATDALTRGLTLLALDEVEVTDIADAAIVGRVFARILGQGVTVVATSNRAPADLYRAAHKRDLVLPFVRLLEEEMDVIHLCGARDYRRAGTSADDLYHLDGPDSPALDARWRDLAGPEECFGLLSGRVTLRRKGRVLRGCFDTLCRAPLAAMHYREMARDARGLFLDAVPILGRRDEDAARRFILLVDTLYDMRRGLVIAAATEPEELYRGEEFDRAFDRTASRLHEMRRPDWPGNAGLR